MDDYIEIPIKQLLEGNESPCDFYLSLSKEKFIKVIRANDFYDEEFIMKHILKSVKCFYIKKEDEPVWEKHKTAVVKLKLEKAPIIGDDPARLLKEAFLRARELCKKVGLDDDTIETVESIQEKSIKMFRKNKDIYSLICKLISKNNYLSDHSLLVSSIACAVAINMSWSTKATLKKFVIAGLFHDISLDDERLAKIRVLSELEVEDFSSKEKQDIKYHPEDSKDIFLKLGISCPNADKIIEHHHELPDGSGFPKGLDAFNTPPYICLFNIAEEVVSMLFRNDFSDETWPYLKEKFEKSYMKGNYKKPAKGFQMTFKQLA